MNPLIPVFVASPSDVSEERQHTEKAIHILAPRLARLYGVTLVPLLWEEFAPISSYDSAHPQVGILRRIQPFSIFVGILWQRIGRPIPELGVTGTVSEFNHALAHRDTIALLTYFRAQPHRDARDNHTRIQRRQVRELKRALQERHVTTTNYDNAETFRLRILPDLMEAALDLVLSKEPRKIANYHRFFRFGSHSRSEMRPLLIVYPPITDPGPGRKPPKLHWQERLLPHVVYEDSKAIQDIEEAMRLIGREYKTVTTDSPEIGIADLGDRIWVCVPRNKPALRVLADLGERPRFSFQSHKASGLVDECCLMWRGLGGKEFEIRSPLSKYLAFSARPSERSHWRPAFGHGYCRDYAILARFKVLRDASDETSESFYHYFVGGIRGLGTWGAGHLIDHESSQLIRIAQESSDHAKNREDVQLLLEVTYENFRVKRVVDVSGESEAFFRERYSDKYVKKRLAEHAEWLAL